ncbi:hypothetical protein GGTG_05086 [Gaeumannomyces tritici R3-111a-1]|uniref:HD/PDEase domain-containing protein n=1 Tax=Gaeumannomyces tritici (strain R3-111a-1) TaxID=644352 RepID=J3NUX7_GAET3|nr:hypothetical protein GGTG_05086 [Gaeumannomyces tritici R3-111a-1]EJT75149.1 hypothetical protein GGTG_05086 [Gaeumannomyces tritici R3-111a-1]
MAQSTQPAGAALPAGLMADVTAYVEEYMSHYDGSHDFNHIKRVVALSRSILAEERELAASRGVVYDETLIELGALLHDVGDKKYIQPGQDHTTLVRDVLLQKGADPTLAARVQDLVLHVSFSSEKKDPAKVVAKVAELPELAVVQDADRLDAIGAVGVGRCFAFTGVRGGTLDNAIEHFVEKLELLGGMMKTEAGRRMARRRTERLVEFRGWWAEETLA